jgi:hypothetical protein
VHNRSALSPYRIPELDVRRFALPRYVTRSAGWLLCAILLVAFGPPDSEGSSPPDSALSEHENSLRLRAPDAESPAAVEGMPDRRQLGGVVRLDSVAR